MAIGHYKNLIVWQKSMDLVIEVYKLTENYPKLEIYGLGGHTRKTAISIPSNIAEGSKRSSQKDYRHFLFNAYGSGAELETQIELAKRLDYAQKEDYAKVDALLNEVMRMLNRMCKDLDS
jgi:four helix bundle protein